MRVSLNSFRVALALSAAITNVGAAEPPAFHFPPNHIVGGINLSAVDWPTLCREVKTIAFTRAGVTCQVHPASWILQRFNPGLGVPVAPPPDCEALADETAAYRNVSKCMIGFQTAIKGRSTGDNYDDVPFRIWRDTYFGPWVVKNTGAK